VAADGAASIVVAADAFTDTAGNGNTVSNTYSWTQDDTGPTMTITSNTVDSGSSTNTGAVVLIYTSNEATANFATGDITVTECVHSDFTTASTTVYGSTCTEATNAVTPTVLVAANTFTDALDNDNSVSNTYTWTYDTANRR